MKKLLIGLLFCALGCNAPASHKAGQYLSNSDKDVIPGHIVVDLNDNVSDKDIEELSKVAHTRLHADNDVGRKFKIEVGNVNPDEEDAILDVLNNDPRVESAEKDFKFHALFVPNDPLYGDQWGITRIGSESAWNMTCARSVIVGVIDTGVQTKLSDFAETKFLPGYNFVDNNDDATDRQSHGSHVSSTIAESTHNGIGGSGIAYCATILPVKVLGDDGSGSMSSVSEGVRWAADQGASVINLSLGSSHPSNEIEDAINYALDHNVVVVAANGNSGGEIGYPAAYPGVFAISAIDKNDHITDFSSRGPETVLSAPGKDILQSTVGEGGEGEQYVKYSGTSMSSPMVSGAAAMVVSMGVNKPSAVKYFLQSSADAKGDSEEYGAGIVRADAAVRAVIFNHTMWRLIALAGILFFLRKKINMASVKSKMSIAGTVFAGFGLIPVYFLGILPRLGSFRIFGELAAKPLLEWSNSFGFMVKYLPMANFLPAGLAVLLLLNSKLKNFAGGMALGSAALLGQMFWSNDVNYWAGSLVMRGMLVGSVAVCVYLMTTVFEKKA